VWRVVLGRWWGNFRSYSGWTTVWSWRQQLGCGFRPCSGEILLFLPLVLLNFPSNFLLRADWVILLGACDFWWMMFEIGSVDVWPINI